MGRGLDSELKGLGFALKLTAVCKPRWVEVPPAEVQNADGNMIGGWQVLQHPTLLPYTASVAYGVSCGLTTLH